jgi:hypothetical protein
MSIDRPYKRVLRPYKNGEYSNGGYAEFMYHEHYAQSPEHYTRAFLLIQKDLLELFDYVEPSSRNHKCYSYRIQELLFRACVEVESNCRAILSENGYSKKERWNRDDYKKINVTHHLSSYKIKLPFWEGSKQVRTPFGGWKKGGTGCLPWYDAYNASKHDRNQNFCDANLNNLIDAVCGLLAILSSQFFVTSFSPGIHSNFLFSGSENYIGGIGDYFQVLFPHDWPKEKRYGFDLNRWNEMKTLAEDPFLTIDYSKL